jgi:hypothetical protein
MPITRRRRANPPDQPENNANHSADQAEATPATPEALNNESSEESPATETASASTPATTGQEDNESGDDSIALAATPSLEARVNGEQRGERPEYAPTIEPGRRTSRGELFRRPPQIPAPQPPVAAMAGVALQPPSHEISLPLGNLLHLAYNPSYTGSDEARSALLRKLAQETKTGGRGRCWSCGSLAIAYDHWNTRSKNFGEVGVAFCEICGVWSVM